MWLYDQIGHVAPHFNCLDLRNAVMPLAVPLTLHGTSVSDVT